VCQDATLCARMPLCVPGCHSVCQAVTLCARMPLCVPGCHSVCQDATLCARMPLCVPGCHCFIMSLCVPACTDLGPHSSGTEPLLHWTPHHTPLCALPRPPSRYIDASTVDAEAVHAIAAAVRAQGAQYLEVRGPTRAHRGPHRTLASWENRSPSGAIVLGAGLTWKQAHGCNVGVPSLCSGFPAMHASKGTLLGTLCVRGRGRTPMLLLSSCLASNLAAGPCFWVQEARGGWDAHLPGCW